jgi:hypothetical protein
MPHGVNFLSKQISWDAIKNSRRNVEKSLILSENANFFAVARELAAIDRPTVFVHTLVDALVFSSAFFTVYVNNRKKYPKLVFHSKPLTYFTSTVFAAAAIILIKVFDKSIEETYKDQHACALGLDLCEGAVEYYQKLRQRNLAFREILADGANLIDEHGNLKYFVFKIPYLNASIKIRRLNEDLGWREEFCRKQMISALQKFEKEGNELAPIKNPSEVKTNTESKELEFFKNIRLSMESARKDKKSS